MFDRSLFGKRLKYFRWKRGLTQEQLAEKADISYSYLLHLESGDNTPSIQVMVNLLNVMGINYSELMSDYDYEVSLDSILLEKLKNATEAEIDIALFILSNLQK
jgi:transcriptional regulator with XRE-family HTH domain